MIEFDKVFYKKQVIDEFEKEWSMFHDSLKSDEWFPRVMELLISIKSSYDKDTEFFKMFRNSYMNVDKLTLLDFNLLRNAIGYYIFDDGECNLIKSTVTTTLFGEESTVYFVSTSDMTEDKGQWLFELVKDYVSFSDIDEIKYVENVPLTINDFMAIMEAINDDGNYTVHHDGIDDDDDKFTEFDNSKIERIFADRKQELDNINVNSVKSGNTIDKIDIICAKNKA